MRSHLNAEILLLFLWVVVWVRRNPIAHPLQIQRPGDRSELALAGMPLRLWVLCVPRLQFL